MYGNTSSASNIINFKRMKDIEPRIEELIKEIQNIELCKGYCVELVKKIKIEARTLDALERELASLEKQLDDHKSFSKLKSLLKKARVRHQEKEKKLKDQYLSKSMEIDEHQKLIDILNFELNVLNKKIATEHSLKKEFAELVIEREQSIKQHGSFDLNRILKLVKEIDDNKKLYMEILEIMDEGKNVIKILNNIFININHRLTKSYNTDPKTPSFTKECEVTISDIQLQAVNLKKSIKAFKKELTDVYEYENLELIYNNRRAEYFSSLSYGELIIKELARKEIGQKQIKELKKLQLKVVEINRIFSEELDIIESNVMNLQKEKMDLIQAENK